VVTLSKLCHEAFGENVPIDRVDGLGQVLRQVVPDLQSDELVEDLRFLSGERNGLVHNLWVYHLSDKELSEYQSVAMDVLYALCQHWKLVHYNVGLGRYKAKQAREQAQARNNKRGRDDDDTEYRGKRRRTSK
jgi:hypothetical protein